MGPFSTACCAAALLAALSAPSSAAGPRSVRAPESESPPAGEVMRLGLRGVYFVENQGQWGDESVEYGFKTRGLDIAFRESSFTMHLSRERSEHRGHGEPDCVSPTGATSVARFPNFSMLTPDLSHDLSSDRVRSGSLDAASYEHLTLTVTFPGSNPATPRGAQPQEAKFNYYIGDDETRWASNVPSFGAIVYENLYDGVDLLICGNDDGVLKYEFHVAPGADWNQIRIAYDGIDSLCVEESGDLRIRTSFGTLMDSAPLVWQEDADSTSRAREEAELDVGRDAPLPDRRGSSEPTIPARFELVDATTYRFALGGPVDPTRPLIIDPDVEWMLYLGGWSYDSGRAIAVDSFGNSLVTGRTSSGDIKGRNNQYHGTSDAYVMKLTTDSLLVWMTYLGGTRIDYGEGVALDRFDDVVVAGYTESPDFAGRNNSLHRVDPDAFVLKIKSTGSLQWMTYLGGTRHDTGYDVAVDSVGNAVVAGWTQSTDFEGQRNAHYGGHLNDGFVAKVSPAGATTWMVYLGGTGDDVVSGIAVNDDDDAHVTGLTSSTDFDSADNANHGGEDAYVAKIDSSGQVRWMIYLGGSETDQGRDIALDRAGNVLVAGRTSSTDFGGQRNEYHGRIDAFIAKISRARTVRWMRYLGGSDADEGNAVAVDDAGHVLISGETRSSDFEGRTNDFRGATQDGFVARASASGTLKWTTYLGGSGSGQENANGVAMDGTGNVLVTGWTASTDFEGSQNLHHGGTYDAFLVKVRRASNGSLQLVITAGCPTGGSIRVEWSGATPQHWMALVFAVETGALTLPPSIPCNGTTLGLGSRRIQVVWTGNTGEQGTGSIGRFAGPGACGGYLQLLDLATCSTSNVARIE